MGREERAQTAEGKFSALRVRRDIHSPATTAIEPAALELASTATAVAETTTTNGMMGHSSIASRDRGTPSSTTTQHILYLDSLGDTYSARWCICYLHSSRGQAN